MLRDRLWRGSHECRVGLTSSAARGQLRLACRMRHGRICWKRHTQVARIGDNGGLALVFAEQMPVRIPGETNSIARRADHQRGQATAVTESEMFQVTVGEFRFQGGICCSKEAGHLLRSARRRNRAEITVQDLEDRSEE